MFAVQGGVVLLARMPGEALGDAQDIMQEHGADHRLGERGRAEIAGEGGIEGYGGG